MSTLTETPADFRDFLVADFDAERYAATAAAGSDIATLLARISFGIESLKRQLSEQIDSRHDDLLWQLAEVKEVDALMRLVREGISSLSGSLERLKKQIEEPHLTIKTLTLQLERLQDVAELLRQLIRYLALTRRLRAHVDNGDERELQKAATCLNEIDSIILETNLDGIIIYDEGKDNVCKAREMVITEAKKYLTTGIETGNQPGIASGLQIFYNMGTLEQRIRELLDSHVQRATNYLHETLDTAVISRLVRDEISANQKLQAHKKVEISAQSVWSTLFWDRMHRFMESMMGDLKKIYLLSTVLHRKRDPITHVHFIKVAMQGLDVSLEFFYWKSICQIFEKEIKQAVKSSNFVQQLLQSEFPKMMIVVSEFFSRAGELGVFSLTEGGLEFCRSMWVKLFASYETQFLSKSLSRLLDPINVAFAAGNKSVSREELVTIASAIHNEITMAKLDSQLTSSIAKNVNKAIAMCAAKFESMILVEGSTMQILSTTSQHNLDLLSKLNRLRELVVEQLHDADAVVVDIVATGLEKINQVMMEIVEPLFANTTKDLENILLKMHHADYSGRSAAPDLRDAPMPPSSPFVHEFNTKLRQFQKDILSKMACGQYQEEWILMMCSRLAMFFLRHACLIKPLGDAGKLKIAADLAQLEFILTSLLNENHLNFDALGVVQRCFRAFKPFLFMDLSRIVSDSPMSEISIMLTVHHLMSRASADLRMPHVRGGWTPSQYSEWLDNLVAVQNPSINEEENTFCAELQTPKAWITKMEESLAEYADLVRKKGERQYTPEFPVILKLLRRASGTQEE